MDEHHRWRQEYFSRVPLTGHGSAWDALRSVLLRSDVLSPPYPRRWDDEQSGFPPMADLCVRNLNAGRAFLRRHHE